MTLYFRLLILFLKTLLFESGRRFEVNNDIVTNLTVFPNDLDLFRHVNNGRFLTLMDLGRFHLLVRSKAMHRIISEGYRPTILDAYINYKKELKLFQKFSLRTKIVYWDYKNFYIKHTFERKGIILAEAVVKGIVIKNKMKIKPEIFLKELGMDIPCPPKPSYLDKFIELNNVKLS